ncbi:asparagine synthase (glutamine-hydrolyzing) [Paenibacillus sp. VTT E-133280]|uniref:asparagine synthase (glutamine-hydrolyzing) n=1 Tax=unclassified Paenibacillus TaxID=185978 RepID=UPI000BA032F2|nr:MULTISPECIES: asparagine synthase (glutamine-hydrolyzing) [unclassified Paenibacillus]MBY3621299.1 asparagine synthase (glutamine-hydrolyzing) [Acinetobacter sp. CUI P1]MDH6373108.1 asparagine synthase (glutamine-hydrolyzing) [Paenibacillus sp. PastF-3]OZQ69024.1 asparagine synthase (glutamine-hydrolyzing) [Paenibacillus sp. VTT E-133280]OZQ97534.1 asparagine synthase (glutamine-hydrolyzing) [Paenibacillus sp. VTT E-133291]
MCGITAVYNRNQVPVQAQMLRQMIEIINHRGPNDSGIHLNGHVGLGFRRLSILDLEHGAQPMHNEPGEISLIFNGEIYNYRELRESLQREGHHFHTESDTEVILRLYEAEGEHFVKRLRGMFGLVIWDQRQQMLLVARDPFGIKPIYYSETPSGFMISSEIKSLLASGKIDREVDGQAFSHYLTFQYVPEPATMFKGINKLMAGNMLVIKQDQIFIKPYFKASFYAEDIVTFPELVEETRAVLMDSVQIHRNSDVPRGAFLSGGIDSSSLVGMLQRLEPTRTFSVGFDVPGYSELELARKTAAHLGTEHYEVSVSAQSYLEALPRMIWHMDEPVADPSAAGIYFVSELASRYVKVVFSGEGADEFFGGYNIYREPLSLRMFNYMPAAMRKLAGAISKGMPAGMKGKSFLERGSLELQERFYGNAKIFHDAEKGAIMPDNLARTFQRAQEVTLPLYEAAAHYDDITKMQHIDIHTWLRGNILMKADKMSMAHSIELRVPFVDPRVFDLASRIPSKYKVNKTTTKLLLREAMKDFVPPDVQSRKKLGFPVPIRIWLKNEWYPWAKEVIGSADDIPWITTKQALGMLEDHRAGKVDASRKLWTILVFILWHQMYITAPTTVPALH